jgi:hypothetical protein
VVSAQLWRRSAWHPSVSMNEHGLLNSPASVFDWLNASCVGWASLTTQVSLWGGVAGASSMALYWLVSPQRKLHEIARRSRESRHRLLDTSRTELPESLAAARELIRWSLPPCLSSRS